MLFDIDKSSGDRGQPTPNHHDKLNPSAVPAKGTNSVNYITGASNTSAISGAKNGQFTIVQVGNFTTTQSYSATDPGAGNHGLTQFTIYQQPHGLPFTPTILAFEQSSAGQYTPMPLIGLNAPTASTASWYVFDIFVDATNVYITLNVMSFGDLIVGFNPGFIFKWYLMEQVSTQ